jgi:hypothetical protein
VLAAARLVASEGYLQAAMLLKGRLKMLMLMGVLAEPWTVLVKSRPPLNCPDSV